MIEEGTRIIPCSACGGDKGHHDFVGHWSRCIICNGSGEEEQRLCAKCGSPTRGEEALVDGKCWCHPCADEAL